MGVRESYERAGLGATLGLAWVTVACGNLPSIINMHSSSLRGYGTFDSYEGCRGLYPATSRLQSVPPRFYDLVDGESGRVLASDLTSGATRARSMIRQKRLAEERAWPQPVYGDMVIGPTASAGHYSVPRTSGEFSRDIISRSRSPSPCPDAINKMNTDMIDSVNEKLHLSNMRNRFPETYRGQSSTYNQSLGRYQTSYDSPGFRYYRYDNHQEGPRISHSRVNQHMPRFSTRCRERVSVPPICPDISALTRRVKAH